ncbi:MAG: Porphobilinogen deaminase, partial [uncultured Solirubrobacteraceae bacterium]
EARHPRQRPGARPGRVGRRAAAGRGRGGAHDDHGG